MKHMIVNKFNEALNDALFMSETNIALLATLEGSCFHIQFTDIKLSIFLVFLDTGVTVLTESPQQLPNATLKGSIINLVGAGITKSADRIEIIGDARKANSLQKVLRQIELPINKIISSKFGDDLGYAVESLGNGVKRLFDSASENCRENVTGYVNQELGLCVEEQEFLLLHKRVTGLRDRVSMIEKKVKLRNANNTD